MRVSVITPVHETRADVLRECIESVLEQTYDDLEFCIVDDGSTSDHVGAILEEYAQADSRIRLRSRPVTGGIAAASNDALAIATGEFVALLDHDDVLHRRALECVVAAASVRSEADYIYTDEDLIDLEGQRCSPFRKPDWSPERFRSQMYCGHLSVFRRSLVDEIGGFDQRFEGSQDYDLVLRVTERARDIVHVPEVLYHWRMGEQSVAHDPSAKPWAYEAGVRSVQAHCDRIGLSGVVTATEVPGCHRIRRTLTSEPRVSMIVPTVGHKSDPNGETRTPVVDAVRDVLDRTNYSNLEVIVVSDVSTPESVIDGLDDVAGHGLKAVVRSSGPLCHSRAIDIGACHASGEFLLLLGDRVRVVTADWIETMVGIAQDDDVGVVGVRLLQPNGMIQHAGFVLEGIPLVAYHGRDPAERGLRGYLHVDREISGVSAACALVKSTTFAAVGGMSMHLPDALNDIDFCLKVRHLNYRIIWTPHATLIQEDAQLRMVDASSPELEFLRTRWSERLVDDPYHCSDPATPSGEWSARSIVLPSAPASSP